MSVLFPGSFLNGGSDGIWIQTNASFNLYADTTNVVFSGQGVQNSRPAVHAPQFHYWGTSRNTSVHYGGNDAFFGTFYAPNADFNLGGGGSFVIDFSGSIVCKTLQLNGNYWVHYDENLKRTGALY